MHSTLRLHLSSHFRCRSQPKRLTDLDLIPRIRRRSGKKKKLGLKAKEALRNEADRRKSARVDLKVAERREKLSSRRRRNEEQESLESDSSWDDEAFLLTMQAAGESARPTHVVVSSGLHYLANNSSRSLYLAQPMNGTFL